MTLAYDYDSDALLTQARAEVLKRSADNGLLAGATLPRLTTSQCHKGADDLQPKVTGADATRNANDAMGA